MCTCLTLAARSLYASSSWMRTSSGFSARPTSRANSAKARERDQPGVNVEPVTVAQMLCAVLVL